MLAAAKPVCFVLAADLPEARAFYTDTLGLTETGEDPFAVSYDLAGTTMRLTRIEGHQPGPHTVLGWQVADIAAAISALSAKGVAFAIYEGFGQDALGVWTDPGSDTRIAWFHDPEGNNLSLTQAG
ncbi:MAG: VOC family protein [Erythrobacter sp.]|uniref:VOC family protein n=1 Tax=Erythrobacter sp. TaxID=1042 RepID=UPI0025F23941|nr:VOC family protein [Erythrobacter sp.]MCM0001166.1 VOC family protein [Erythrobacter sp.]